MILDHVFTFAPSLINGYVLCWVLFIISLWCIYNNVTWSIASTMYGMHTIVNMEALLMKSLFKDSKIDPTQLL